MTRFRFTEHQIFAMLKEADAGATAKDLCRCHGISLDNGPELRSRAVDQWAYEHGVLLDFIQPGKPTQNAMIESFNGKMLDELLNTRWWRSLAEARAAVAAHVEDYNLVRPHDSLARRTPQEYARTLTASQLALSVPDCSSVG